MTQTNFDVVQSVKLAWEKVKGSKKTFWAGLVLIIIIRLVLEGLDRASDHIEQPGLIAFIIGILAFIFIIIQSFLYWGLIYIGARRADDLPISVADYKYPFSFFLLLKMIGLYIVSFLIFLIPMLLIIAPAFLLYYHQNQQLNWLFYIAIVIGVIALIFLSIRLYLAKIILIYQNTNPLAAIAQSFRITKNNVWKLIWLGIINTVILLISIIPLGIGLIWSIPYILINYGVVYKKLTQQV